MPAALSASPDGLGVMAECVQTPPPVLLFRVSITSASASQKCVEIREAVPGPLAVSTSQLLGDVSQLLGDVSQRKQQNRGNEGGSVPRSGSLPADAEGAGPPLLLLVRCHSSEVKPSP